MPRGSTHNGWNVGVWKTQVTIRSKAAQTRALVPRETLMTAPRPTLQPPPTPGLTAAVSTPQPSPAWPPPTAAHKERLVRPRPAQPRSADAPSSRLYPPCRDGCSQLGLRLPCLRLHPQLPHRVREGRGCLGTLAKPRQVHTGRGQGFLAAQRVGSRRPAARGWGLEPDCSPARRPHHTLTLLTGDLGMGARVLGT